MYTVSCEFKRGIVARQFQTELLDSRSLRFVESVSVSDRFVTVTTSEEYDARLVTNMATENGSHPLRPAGLASFVYRD